MIFDLTSSFCNSSTFIQKDTGNYFEKKANGQTLEFKIRNRLISLLNRSFYLSKLHIFVTIWHKLCLNSSDMNQTKLKLLGNIYKNRNKPKYQS